MNDHEPDLSLKARALVEAGRALDAPSSADRSRVRTRLAATLGAAGSLTAADRVEASAAEGGGAVSAISGAGFSAKLGAGLLMIALVAAIAGIVSLRAERPGVAASSTTAPHVLAGDAKPSQERVPLAAGSTSTTSVAAAPIEHTSTNSDRKRQDLAELERPPRAVWASVAIARKSPSAATRAKNAVALSSATANDVPQPTAAAQAATASVAPAPTAAAPREPDTASQTVAQAVAPTMPPSAATDGPPQTTATPRERAADLAGELALLGAAQRAMASGHLPRALQLLDQHAARYRTGSLVPERLAARAATLCRMKRTAEGLRELHRLQMHSPTSPLLSWARESCPAGP